QIDTLGKQFGALMQHVTVQAVPHVQTIPVMPQPTVNVSVLPINSPVVGRPVQWQQSSKPTSNARPRACFNCGDSSHIKPQRPLLQSNAPISNSHQTPVNVQAQPQKQGSFICRDPSHFKRICPQWLKNNSTAAL